MKPTYLVLTFCLLLCIWSMHGFGQTTVTFDEITTTPASSLNGTGTYDNSGVRFSIIPGSNVNAKVSSTEQGYNNTRALDDDNLYPGGIAGWSIKKVNGSGFQLISIWLQEGCNCASTTGTIKAYKNGAQVGSTVNLTFDSRISGNKIFSSNPDFYNVDEIRIEASDVFLFIDNFKFGDPISVSNEAPPILTGINLVGTPFSTATSVDFTVSFSKNAKNVSIDDFQLTTSGALGTISSVNGSGSIYTVKVNGISGEGTIRLDLKAGTNIANEDDFTGTPAYTGGQLHFVGSCYTESFENIVDGMTSFSSNGQTFSLGTGLEVENRVGFGAGPTASNRYIKNNFNPGSFAITAANKFTIGRVDLFLSDQTNDFFPTGTGTLTIVGRLEGVDQFIITKNSGFPTTTAVNNGYFTINFATEGGINNSNVNIDELVFTIGGGFKEFCIDNFNFCMAAPDVDTQAPAIQSLTLLGTPGSTANAVSFQAVFNEVATHVSLDDFSLHVTGTATGVLSSINGSGTTYTLGVTGISGEGTIQVRLKNGTDIQDVLGNTPPIEYVNGQLHYVGACYVETFESLAEGVTNFVSNGKNFSLTGNWKVHRQSGFGINTSNAFLLNTGNGPFTLRAADDPVAFSQLAFFLSSSSSGMTPTADGTLTIRGKKGSSTMYEIVKNTGFPTNISSNSGFFLVDFATAGTGDFSEVFVDALEIEVTGFVYLALDNLGYCSDFEAPSGYTASIDQNPVTIANQTAVSFTFAGAELGTTFNYIFSGVGGTNVTGSGTVTSATQQVTGINLTGLDPGTVTLSVTLTDASGNVGQAATNTSTKIINNNPTDITLSNNSINQSSAANAQVGTLSSSDPDVGDTFTYTLVSGTGSTNNASFNISGTSLRATDPSSLTAGYKYVRIRTTDNMNGTFEKEFVITVVDDVAPIINSVSVPANATYGAGQNLDFTLNLSEPVTVTGTPSIPLTIGSTSVHAIYWSGSTTSALTFRYIIQAGDADANGIELGSAIALHGGTINDGGSHPLTLALNGVGSTTGILIDAVAPSVSSLVAPADGSYGIADVLYFTVNFDEAVTVITGGGSPRIPLTMGSTTRYATYRSGSGSTALMFSYTIVAGDNDSDGIVVGNSIELNGGTFTDLSGNIAATTLNNIGSTANVRVDGVLPTVLTFSPANGSSTMNPSDNLLITFSEAISLGTGNIIIYDDASTPVSIINVTNHLGQLSVVDNVLTINSDVDLLELTDYYVRIGNNAIHDLAGNAYAGISNNTTWAFTTKDVTPPSGYGVSIDQSTITVANHMSLSFTFSAAEVGATFNYEITNSSGGTAVTGSGTIISANQQVSGIDVSGLINGTLTLSVTLKDVAGNVGNPATDGVTKAVNYLPIVTTSGGTTSFTESLTGMPLPVIIDHGLTVSDADNSTLASATVSITGNFTSGEDILNLVNGPGMGNISSSYTTGTLTLTSAGATATLAEWQTALRAVTYSNSSSDPNEANRTITFIVNDGLANSTNATKSVSVTAVNNAPIITNLDGDNVTFTEKGPAVLIDTGGDATVSDPDSPDFDGGVLTVSIVSGGVVGSETVSIRDEGMAAGQIGLLGSDVYYGGNKIASFSHSQGGNSLVLTLESTSTTASVQSVIRNLTYSNLNTVNPTSDPRIIHITLTDGDGAISVIQEVTVNIALVNDAPILTTSAGSTTFTEPMDDDFIPVIIDSGITLVDPDHATLASATVQISVGFVADQDELGFVNTGNAGNISGSYQASTGVLTLTSAGATATLAEWSAALRSVTYTNLSHHPNTAGRIISFVVNDGIENSAITTKTIHIVATNTAPVLTAPLAQNVDQDDELVFGVLQGNSISVADVDAGAGLIQISLTATNGVIRLGNLTGLTFTAGNGLNNTTMTFQGIMGDINHAFEGMKFIPSNGYNGPASLYLLTDDLGNFGTGGPLTDNSTVQIEVIDVIPPAIPVGLTAMPGDTHVTLEWTANSDVDLNQYIVYGGIQPNPTTEITRIAATSNSFTHTGLINGTLYYYRMTAVDDVGNESSFSTEVSATPMGQQSIDFGALGDATYGDEPIDLAAKASSGLVVQYVSSDPSIASITGQTLKIHAAGLVTITANQPGNTSFLPAVPVSQNLLIHKATITGVVFDSKTLVFDGANHSLTVSGLPQGATVSYSANNQQQNVGIYTITATVKQANYIDLTLTAALKITEATAVITADAVQKHVYDGTLKNVIASLNHSEAALQFSARQGETHAGIYQIRITAPATRNYKATSKDVELIIEKAKQKITFQEVGTVSRDQGQVSLQASSSSGLPIHLEVNDDLVATIKGTDLFIHRLGRVRITATQSGNENYEPAEPVSIIVEVASETEGPIRVHPALSPNGDGLNEFLILEGIKEYPENQVQILNRNGQVVFEISGYDNANRVFRGIGNTRMSNNSQLPGGTYFYVLQYTDSGKTKVKKGYFVLRK